MISKYALPVEKAFQGKEKSALCYFNQAGSAGWCGTCYEGDLRPGQEGYCDYYNGKTYC